MEIIKIEDYSFQYSSSDTAALDEVSFSVKSGEFVTVCGCSGSGKSTLLRTLKPSLSPPGVSKGGIFWCGKDISLITGREECSKIGFVMQDPRAQFVSGRVRHELAFLCESLGMNRSQMRRRISELVEFFRLSGLLDREADTLSGGQMQMVNLASAMSADPELILLDEPTAMLDPVACEEFINMLKKINTELGVAVVIATHAPSQTLECSDRLVVMESGRITHDGSTKEIALALCRGNNPMAAALGAGVRVCSALCGGYAPDVPAAREILGRYQPAEFEIVKRHFGNEDAVRINDVYFAYERGNDVLKGLSLNVKCGEVTAICGGNGAGKSTLLGVISGILKPYGGSVKLFGKNIKSYDNLYDGTLAMLMQSCERMFTHERLAEELLGDAFVLAEKMGLGGLMESHPYDLSGGERQKAALCKILVKKPKILLLDEPSKGLDAPSKDELVKIVHSLSGGGVTVIMVTHDLDFAAECADRCIMLSNGEIAGDAEPHEFFRENRFYTTQTARICRGRADAVSAEELFLAYGVKDIKPSPPSDRGKKCVKAEQKGPEKKHKSRLSLITVALMPVVAAGSVLLGFSKYYMEINAVILLLAAVSFFMNAESHANNSGALTLTAVMSALAAVSRLAFAGVPQFKPALAVVIMAGISLGCETGAAVGALGMFLSNFYFGQSIVAPWQMFGFAFAGFLAGAYGKTPMAKSRAATAVFGFLCAMPLYGVIVNTAGVMLYQPEVTAAALISAYAAGLIFDVIHAAATAVTLLIFAPAMREKIGRVKLRYRI